MKFSVDAALCSGHGQCYATSPQVFGADDDGFNRDSGRTVDVPPELEQAARDGAGVCPEQAIAILA